MKKRWFVVLCVAALLILQPPDWMDIVSSDAYVELPAEPKYVALTFDDGPHPEQTKRLLDGLLARETRATFFLVGEQLAGNEDLVLRMGREGHQVGNHTWSHKSLQEAKGAAFQEEIRRVEEALEEILGKDGAWLRPPYGQITAAQMAQVNVPLVKWSVDPRDWESRNTAQVVQAVLETVEPGSIILLHDIYPTSVEAALVLVDRLREQGYAFVTVEELLLRSGIEPQPGVMYRAAEGQITSKGTG